MIIAPSILLILYGFVTGVSIFELFIAGPLPGILISILYPAAMSFGIDPVAFGIIMAVNLSIGSVTLPLGVDLFIAEAITDFSIERIVVRIPPYILILVVDLLLISLHPPLLTLLIDVIR